MDWLQTVTDSLASQFNADPAALTVSAGDRRELLDIARIASHESGERINAPLLCYVLGVLAARGTPLSASIPAVRSNTLSGNDQT